MSLTLSSYFHGHRTAEAAWIPFNPFYNAAHHRYSAATYVQTYRIPVLRDSSVEGFYAVTHMYGGRVLHTLLRQNADGSVDVVNESGAATQHFGNLYEVLDRILAHMGYVSLPMVPTASAPPPSVATSVASTRDPINVVVVSEDPN